MYKSSTARFDAIDAIRYGVMSRPDASKIGGDDDREFIEMRKKDPGTAAEWQQYARKKAIRMGRKKNVLADMDSDNEGIDFDEGEAGKRGWDFGGE